MGDSPYPSIGVCSPSTRARPIAAAGGGSARRGLTPAGSFRRKIIINNILQYQSLHRSPAGLRIDADGARLLHLKAPVYLEPVGALGRPPRGGVAAGKAAIWRRPADGRAGAATGPDQRLMSSTNSAIVA